MIFYIPWTDELMFVSWANDKSFCETNKGLAQGTMTPVPSSLDGKSWLDLYRPPMTPVEDGR